MNWHARHKEGLTFGQRAADVVRNGMGSWRFVMAATVLSCVAALQGAILLIAAKRADEVAAALAKHDADVNIEAERRIEQLQIRIAVLENEKHDEILRGIAALQRTITGFFNS